jgi:hypothetical protein
MRTTRAPHRADGADRRDPRGTARAHRARERPATGAAGSDRALAPGSAATAGGGREAQVILVDTSVWVEHLRRGSVALAGELEAASVDSPLRDRQLGAVVLGKDKQRPSSDSGGIDLKAPARIVRGVWQQPRRAGRAGSTTAVTLSWPRARGFRAQPGPGPHLRGACSSRDVAGTVLSANRTVRLSICVATMPYCADVHDA